MAARRGAAVMVALMVTSFLFVLGVGLLYFLERDGQAALVLQRTQKALVLARAGINFARYQELQAGPNAIAAGGVHRIYALDPLEEFEVWKEADASRTVHSRGRVKTANGTVVASRELATPTVLDTDPTYPLATFMNLNVWDVDL